ncbi:hypothetical protein OG322_01240 [Streptomyces sp. NBC_01260]|uniref:hypothetical protein n=1 Tax=unclassified Streptomyces TaxID=2593676 RepID=UPI002E338289|nr:hypothetical protein [Streptomyces sp. NBC_01260]
MAQGLRHDCGAVVLACRVDTERRDIDDCLGGPGLCVQRRGKQDAYGGGQERHPRPAANAILGKSGLAQTGAGGTSLSGDMKWVCTKIPNEGDSRDHEAGRAASLTRLRLHGSGRWETAT